MALPPGEYALRAYFDGKPVGKDSTIRLGPGGLDMKEPIALAGGDSKSAGDSKSGGDPK